MKKTTNTCLTVVTFFLMFFVVMFFAPSVFAEEKSPTVDVQAVIKVLQEQIKTLQAQITELKSQLKDVNVKVEALTFTRTLAFGSRGDDIKRFQQYLIQEGYSIPAGATGYYGDQTKAAVKKFQEEQGIESVGFAGPKTIAKLNEVVNTIPAVPVTPVIPAIPAVPGLTPAIPAIPVAPLQITTITPTTTITTSPSETIPAVPAQSAISAQPSSTTNVPTVPAVSATPATPAQPAVTSTPIPTPTPTPTPLDITAPSVPANITATAFSSTQINLSWSVSTDNVGVTGYRLYRGGNQIAIVTIGISYSDIGLSPSTAYTYTIAAYDVAGNVSAQSNSVSATTLALMLPDLTVSFTNTLPASVAAGSDITFPISMSNIGAANVGAFDVVLTFGGVTKTMTQSTLLSGNILGSYFQVTAPSTPGSYTVLVKIDPNNTILEVNEGNNSVSAVINVILAGPPTPTNFDGATSGDIQSQPPRIGLYLVWNYALQSATKAFNVYMKKPSESAFTKYTYADPANLPIAPGWLPLPVGTTPSFYRQPDQYMWRIYDQVADTVWEMGEYKFYVTVTDATGAESVPTATKSFKFYRAPTIVSPANGSTVSVTPRITITEDPAAVSLGLVLYKKNNDWIDVPGWWPAPRDFTYNGPALTANGNPHRLVAYSVGGLNERSLNAVSIFNVSTTTSSLDLHAKNLAAIGYILESLKTIVGELLKLH